MTVTFFNKTLRAELYKTSIFLNNFNLITGKTNILLPFEMEHLSISHLFMLLVSSYFVYI